jgi:chromosome partitioning protein
MIKPVTTQHFDNEFVPTLTKDMKFARPKKLLFINNKGGVGKTTTAYNFACNAASKGYKTVLVDLDPQTNLTLQALGYEWYVEHLYTSQQKSVYDIVKPLIEGDAGIDLTVPLVQLRENLSILPGSINLSLYEDALSTGGYMGATTAQPGGLNLTSALYRYLNEKGLNEHIDLFVIDSSPTLSMLNRIVFLMSDYFAVPLMPDAFSVQGIENLGKVFASWKQQWNTSAKALATLNDSPASRLLPGDALFIGYLINAYKVYNDHPANDHQKWIDTVPDKVRTNLSEKHGRNGLVEKSWKTPLATLQHYQSLSATSQKLHKPIYEITEAEAQDLQGKKENIEKSKVDYNLLTDSILEILAKY